MGARERETYYMSEGEMVAGYFVEEEAFRREMDGAWQQKRENGEKIVTGISAAAWAAGWK